MAIVAVFFFAATALALVSFAIGPFGFPEEDRPALQAGAAVDHPLLRGGDGVAARLRRGGGSGNRRSPCARSSRPRSCSPARACSTWSSSWRSPRSRSPASRSCSTGRRAPRVAVAATMLAGGYGLAVVSTFLSALVARGRAARRALRPHRVSAGPAAAADGDRGHGRGHARGISVDGPAGHARVRRGGDRRGVYAGGGGVGRLISEFGFRNSDWGSS